MCARNMADVVHDIVIHYQGRYSYIELLNDVAEKIINELPSNINVLLSIRCAISRTFTFMNVSSDASVTEMFSIHVNASIINLYVSDMNIMPPPVDKNPVNKSK